MKKFRIILSTLFIAGLAVSLLMGCGDDEESVSEDICAVDIQCGYIEEDQFDICVAEMRMYIAEVEYEEGEQCRDYFVDLLDCSAEVGQDDCDAFDSPGTCEAEWDRFDQNCY